MSLSVRVRASSDIGVARQQPEIGRFRARRHRPGRRTWRSVSSASGSGSSQGSQPSCALGEGGGDGRLGRRDRSVMTSLSVDVDRGCHRRAACRRSGRAGEHAQAGDHADLEGEEGDELRQRHDAGGRPAGIEQRPAAPPALASRGWKTSMMRMRQRGRQARPRAPRPASASTAKRRRSRPRRSAARRDSGRRGRRARRGDLGGDRRGAAPARGRASSAA